MQDSLEDYIRISRNCKEGPTEVKKEVLITAQIKQECDAKALQILQFAIEGKMRSESLFKCLPYINQSHYQDIVEERAISKLCGYPLCSKRIPDMPKKQFYISTKNNKVYDITDRKNYCSNFCYRASLHIKGQIDTSPLWLRKHTERVNYTLLDKTEKGLPGLVIDQGITKPAAESLFTSISSFTQMSLDEAEELEMNPQEEETKKRKKKPRKYQKNTMKTINENEEEDEGKSELNENLNMEKIEEKGSVEISNKENQEMKNKNSIKKEKTPLQNKQINYAEIESHISKCVKDWLTLETFTFIHGEEKVKEKLDKQKLSHYFDSLKISQLQVEQQKRYIDICRKLHLRELAEEKFDSAVIGNEALKSLPDYQRLKEESREMDLKVKSFYSGELHIQEDKNFPTKKQEETNEEEEQSAVLPLVDVNSQNALRRKIFLNSLNRTVQTLFQTLKISPSLVLSDLQSLVKTFKFKADNIVFKPAVWTYITIILLKILALKDENLRTILDEENSKTQLNLLLSPLPHKSQILKEILNILLDIDSFVENFICK